MGGASKTSGKAERADRSGDRNGEETWEKSEHTVNQRRVRHSHYANANSLRQQGSLQTPFPVSPRGKRGRAGSPHAAGTLCASKKHWHTSLPRLPPQGGFQSAPLKPPLRIPPNGHDRDRVVMVGLDLRDREKKFKDGRHVGLDFYDLLIEGYQLDRKKSWRGSAVMRHPKGDKIMIKRDARSGHYVYFSVRDDRDNGTIIDFVQRRQHMSIGAVRKELRPWMGMPPVPTPT